MKLTIEQTKLAELLETVYLAVSPKPTNPILGNILIVACEDGTILATATNLNFSICMTTTANVEISGSAALPAKLLTHTVSSLRGEISLEVSKQICTIVHSSGKCRLFGGSPEMFPVLPLTENPIAISLSAKRLQAALENTLYCVSSDESKLILTGINFEINADKWQLVSTDAHRLALATGTLDIEYPKPINFTVPSRSLVELNKILSSCLDTSICNILLVDGVIQFNLSNIKVISRLLEGDYPKINGLIPRKFEYEFILQQKELENALKRVSNLADRKQKIVKIRWSLECLQATLYTESTDVGNAVDSVAMKVLPSNSKNDIDIGLNIDYILEGLKHISTYEVVVRCNQPGQPVIVCPVGGLFNLLYLVMPVRIEDAFKGISAADSKAKTEVASSEEVRLTEEKMTEPISEIEVTAKTMDSETSSTELQPTVAKTNSKSKKKSDSRLSRSKKKTATA